MEREVLSKLFKTICGHALRESQRRTSWLWGKTRKRSCRLRWPIAYLISNNTDDHNNSNKYFLKLGEETHLWFKKDDVRKQNSFQVRKVRSNVFKKENMVAFQPKFCYNQQRKGICPSKAAHNCKQFFRQFPVLNMECYHYNIQVWWETSRYNTPWQRWWWNRWKWWKKEPRKWKVFIMESNNQNSTK